METDDPATSELSNDHSSEKAGLISHIACHFCGLEFDVKKTRTLRAHIEEVHVLGNSGYLCGICCEEFTSRKTLETHMNTFHRAPKPLGCGICGETFKVRNMLIKHIDCHTKEEIDRNKVGLCYCGECFEFFNSVMSLQIHSTTHRERPVFVCGACGLQTQHRHVMVKHLETHVISNLLTASSKEHDMHKLKSVEINPDLIEYESKPQEVRETDDVEESEDKAKNNEETFYRCGICSTSFINLNEALSHTETHQGADSQLIMEEMENEQLNT